MPQDVNQWIEAVTRLTALTQEGKLLWVVRTPLTELTSTIGPSYFANYKDRKLRLEKRSVSDPDVYSGRRIERPVLEFVDNQDQSLWTFPHVDAVEHLYGAVRYQTAGVKDFLGDLLGGG